MNQQCWLSFFILLGIREEDIKMDDSHIYDVGEDMVPYMNSTSIRPKIQPQPEPPVYH